MIRFSVVPSGRLMTTSKFLCAPMVGIVAGFKSVLLMVSGNTEVDALAVIS